MPFDPDLPAAVSPEEPDPSTIDAEMAELASTALMRIWDEHRSDLEANAESRHEALLWGIP